MSGRDRALIAAAIVIAALCARLGLWQLERLDQRREHNARVLSRLELPPVPLDSILRTPGEHRYRRAVVHGRYDSRHEIVLANRPRRGSPGVHILTPLHLPGSDTAVLVLRGWVYAPDAAHAELERWREDSADGEVGYIQAYEPESPGRRGVLADRILHRLSYQDAAAAVPYRIASYLVVLTDSADPASGRPPRLDAPALGEGNHLSYAFQWFSFAVIALAGTVVFLLQSRRARVGRTDPFEPR